MDPLTVTLIVVAMLVLAVSGFSWGYDRGRNAGRMEVLADWWAAEHPEPVEPEDSLAWLLDIEPRHNLAPAQPPIETVTPSPVAPRVPSAKVVGG